MGFQTDTENQIKKLNVRLNKIGSVGIPKAAAGTLDNMAFESRKIATRIFKGKHIIRSTWTQRGMLFEETRRGIPIKHMESRSGNVLGYAGLLEKGGTIKAENKYLPIPALGSRISKSKHKRISRRFRTDKLQVRRMPKISGSPKRRFAAMLNIARKEKFFGPFLVTKDDAGSDRLPHGIFNLSGRGRSKRKGGKITMLRKLQASAHIPGRPFVAPAGRRLGGRMDRIYIKQAQRALKRFGKDIK